MQIELKPAFWKKATDQVCSQLVKTNKITLLNITKLVIAINISVCHWHEYIDEILNKKTIV